MSNMDKSKEQYRTASAAQAKRIQEFAEFEDPTNRGQEIAVCRSLIEECLTRGDTSTSTVVALLNTLDRLQKNEFRRMLSANELITKPSIKRFCDKMVSIFAEEIEVLPGFESVLLRVSDRVGEATDELRNETKDSEKIAIPR